MRVSQALDRVRQVARLRKKERFTALLHHVSIDLLRMAFYALKRDAAPGVDGLTWRDYEADLEPQAQGPARRVQRGAYRALPSRRRYILKPDGRQRPLAVAALEDKIVQRATAVVLNAIYEEDFLGFSYGFRPGCNQHDALDALIVGISGTKVNWILDADIRSFFDAVSHPWLVRFLEHRIGDPRLLRLIQKWLQAGVLEDGVVRWVEALETWGTGRAGSVPTSPRTTWQRRAASSSGCAQRPAIWRQSPAWTKPRGSAARSVLLPGWQARPLLSPATDSWRLRLCASFTARVYIFFFFFFFFFFFKKFFFKFFKIWVAGRYRPATIRA